MTYSENTKKEILALADADIPIAEIVEAQSVQTHNPNASPDGKGTRR